MTDPLDILAKERDELLEKVKHLNLRVLALKSDLDRAKDALQAAKPLVSLWRISYGQTSEAALGVLKAIDAVLAPTPAP